MQGRTQQVGIRLQQPTVAEMQLQKDILDGTEDDYDPTPQDQQACDRQRAEVGNVHDICFVSVAHV